MKVPAVKRTCRAAVLAMLASIGPTLADGSAQETPTAALERQFDTLIQPSELDAWMKRLAASPNHVGSAHNKANAEWILQKFKSWGWDAHIETYRVLYPTPLHESLTLLGPHPLHATLTEAAIPGDASSSRIKDALPAYVAYQGDGDVTAPLVYVNYGMQEDYKTLERLGVSVKGKIVIARFGAGWRGLKPRLALDHGAVGCILYPDPIDDGYTDGDVYPKGAARPATGIQRGSVADMTQYAGDPLTPGIGATDGAPRLDRAKTPSIVRIPTLPISYGDARHFLERLSGRVAPRGWRGSLPITYHVGGGDVQAHLIVKSDWSLKEIFDVIAVMKGSEFPDQWVLRGNHHDGWVFGASDPMSGQVALLAEAKAFAGLAARGWHPKRTLVYLSWDAEEPMLVGSTEWVETHADELKRKALVYVNSDTNARGLLSISGSPSYQRLADDVAADVMDPETHVSVSERRRAGMLIAGQAPDATEMLKAAAKIAADKDHSLPIAPMGSGSDYSPFIGHLGIAALNLAYGGEGDSKGVYHSSYDTWEHHSRQVDPGFVYDALLARTAGRVVLRVADADAPVQRFGDFADTLDAYTAEVEALAKRKREAATTQAMLLAANAFHLSDDPTKTSGEPTPLEPVPSFDFAPLEDAARHLRESAKRFDSLLAARAGALRPEAKEALFEKLKDIEQVLAPDIGLPGRPWFKNLIYAPGQFTGYAAKTLPGVREAIEEERWLDVERYARLTGDAIEAYARRLDQAIALLPKSGS